MDIKLGNLTTYTDWHTFNLVDCPRYVLSALAVILGWGLKKIYQISKLKSPSNIQLMIMHCAHVVMRTTHMTVQLYACCKGK